MIAGLCVCKQFITMLKYFICVWALWSAGVVVSLTKEEWRQALTTILTTAFEKFGEMDYDDCMTAFTKGAHELAPGRPTNIGIKDVFNGSLRHDAQKFYSKNFTVVDFLSCEDLAVGEVTFIDKATRSPGKAILVLKMDEGVAKVDKLAWNWDN